LRGRREEVLRNAKCGMRNELARREERAELEERIREENWEERDG
jgi:hypothetical protein